MTGQRITESLRFWWTYLGALFLVTLPFSVAGEAVQWLLGPLTLTENDQIQLNIAALLPFIALKPLAEGALIAQLSAIESGKPKSLSYCLGFALALAPVLYAIYGILLLLVGVGWMAFILPGIWLYARFCLAPWIATLEGVPVMNSLQISLLRTRETQWVIFATLCLLGMLALLAATGVAAFMIQLLGENEVSRLLVAIITGLFGCLINVLVFRFYGLTRPASPQPEIV